MLGRVERLFLGLSMAGIAALAILVASTVIGRALFGMSIPDDVVIIQELIVAVIILPLAYVAAQRGHIEVTIFTDRLPRRGRMALDVLGSAIGLVLFGFLAFAGLAVFALRLAVLLAADVVAIATKDEQR